MALCSAIRVRYVYDLYFGSFRKTCSGVDKMNQKLNSFPKLEVSFWIDIWIKLSSFIKLNHWETSVLFILVPPLEGFVMNRVQGDYFETLLYKIFVSIDEHTNVAEVSVTTSYERV